VRRGSAMKNPTGWWGFRGRRSLIEIPPHLFPRAPRPLRPSRLKGCSRERANGQAAHPDPEGPRGRSRIHREHPQYHAPKCRRRAVARHHRDGAASPRSENRRDAARSRGQLAGGDCFGQRPADSLRETRPQYLGVDFAIKLLLNRADELGSPRHFTGDLLSGRAFSAIATSAIKPIWPHHLTGSVEKEDP
jgi:hypothetical protein